MTRKNFWEECFSFQCTIEELEEHLDSVMRENAIGFAEWVEAEGWRQREVAGEWSNCISHKIHWSIVKTTSELYDEYLKSK